MVEFLENLTLEEEIEGVIPFDDEDDYFDEDDEAALEEAIARKKARIAQQLDKTTKDHKSNQPYEVVLNSKLEEGDEDDEYTLTIINDVSTSSSASFYERLFRS